jgi:general L-amino acid transport system permease protein
MSMQEATDAGLWTRNEDQLYGRWPVLYIPPVQKISPAGIISGLASGTQITPEYMALLLGLVVYTAAFIAEIVRAGILAVPNGQLEAARALGLSTGQTLSMIILPQALRVIIPPLGNQFLNLSKNSSLAIAVAYADLVFVTQTIMNQSGQSVTGITMIMLTYLAISLILAALVNLVNRRFQIVTR